MDALTHRFGSLDTGNGSLDTGNGSLDTGNGSLDVSCMDSSNDSFDMDSSNESYTESSDTSVLESQVHQMVMKDIAAIAEEIERCWYSGVKIGCGPIFPAHVELECDHEVLTMALVIIERDGPHHLMCRVSRKLAITQEVLTVCRHQLYVYADMITETLAHYYI